MNVEWPQVQALVPWGYGKCEYAKYCLLQLSDVNSARAWMTRVLPRITYTTGEDPGNGSFANIAFTAKGLGRFGFTDADLRTFAGAFVEGMAQPRRSEILGDVGDNAPAHWCWGTDSNEEVHVLLMIFGKTDRACAELLDEMVPGNNSAIRRLTGFPQTVRRPDTEPFGFADGMSQPIIDDCTFRNRYVGLTPDAHLVKPGEFVLGYPGETGGIAPVPRWLSTDSAEPFGRHGTYLVVRQLQQHVAMFWNYVRSVASRPEVIDHFMRSPASGFRGNQNDSRFIEKWVAAKMVGRWPNGAPLAHSPWQPSDNKERVNRVNANEFLYRDIDAFGLRCPVGAHIRRVNPRDSLLATGRQSLDGLRLHRILRRGRKYGPDATDPYQEDCQERGLFFVCLNAHIEQQFEFIQQSWIGGQKFAGLIDERDPILGNPTQGGRGGQFTIPGSDMNVTLSQIPNFVRVRGGAYFFLPGRHANRRLCGA